MKFSDKIFEITSEKEFDTVAIELFNFQYQHNLLYQQYCDLLKIQPVAVTTINQIPFLPISFFKSHVVKTQKFREEVVFLSSGTTGANQSKHYVKELSLYEKSFQKGFQQVYGDISNYCVLALLPSYMEREGSSLIYMVNQLINKSHHDKSGFYLTHQNELLNTLRELEHTNQKTILFGVSFALLDFAEEHQLQLKNTIIIETGGMKGRRKELTREELHDIYKSKFGVTAIHSEYGMTELLSQAYSTGEGIFTTPKWMKVMIRDVNDPLLFLGENKLGGINVVDLANIYSCGFIATQDLGKKKEGNTFEVLGRFDNSDLRGCNLLIN
ncbi:MAG: acyl transferase [Vicingus serpentipes]|nr:acyl transferase [Vicingus serpentipes]